MNIDPMDLAWKDAHELLIGAIVPRPIALVATVDENGVNNLAPFSFFCLMSVKPAILGFGIGRKRDGRKKDTLMNIEHTQDFVVCIVTEGMANAMNQASREYPRNVDEFKEVGLTALRADLVRSPLVGESPVNMECRVKDILEFGEPPRQSNFVIGEILRFHIQDEVWVHDGVKADRLKAIGRLGEDLYCRMGEIFEMKRPQ